MSPNPSPSVSNPSRSFGPVDSYRVHMLGGPGVGKTALISQFSTSECINAYEDTGKLQRILFPCPIFFHSHEMISVRLESTVEQNVSVILNGVESELKFVIGQKGTKVLNHIKNCFNISL